jgi:chloride channel protein, CIC family
MIALNDLLRARTKNLADERARERVLRIRMPFGRQAKENRIPLTSESDFSNGSEPRNPPQSEAPGKPKEKMRA